MIIFLFYTGFFSSKMGDLNKRLRHMRNMRNAKRQKKIDTTSTTTGTAMISTDFSDILYEAHWEGLSESEEESDIEISEPEDNIEESKDVFERLRCDADTTTTNLPYQRGPTLSKRQ